MRSLTSLKRSGLPPSMSSPYTGVPPPKPHDHDVTEGNLCIKGRFGYEFVQNRPKH